MQRERERDRPLFYLNINILGGHGEDLAARLQRASGVGGHTYAQHTTLLDLQRHRHAGGHTHTTHNTVDLQQHRHAQVQTHERQT